jgi:DNA-binding MarR family transcriptional regulator
MHELVSWCAAQKVKPSEKLVLIALVSGYESGHAGRIGDIATFCGLSKRTVMRALKALRGRNLAMRCPLRAGCYLPSITSVQPTATEDK